MTLRLYSLHHSRPSVHNVVVLYPLSSQKATSPRGADWNSPVGCTESDSVTSIVRICQNSALLEINRACRMPGQLLSPNHIPKCVCLSIHGLAR